MRAAPDAMLDDGLLEVVVHRERQQAGVPDAILPKVFKGTHVHEPGVKVFRARRGRVDAERPFTMYADGDPIGELPVRVRAMPAAVLMLTPAGPGPAFSTPTAADRRDRPGTAMPPAPPPRQSRDGRGTRRQARARAGVGALSRLRGGGATSAPGKVLMRLDPGRDRQARRTAARRAACSSLRPTARRPPRRWRRRSSSGRGIALVHNQAGANMAGGIATTLLAAAGPRGAIAGELGLFEVDELWLDAARARSCSRARSLLGNLFRDQLDRYGELDTIADRWRGVLAGTDAHAGPQRR